MGIIILMLACVFGYATGWPARFAAISLVAQALLFYWIEDQGSRDAMRLLGRIAGYSSVSDVTLHQILLGTLKKVESKATSLAAILVFIAIALITVGAPFNFTGDPSANTPWIVALLLTLLPAFMALCYAFRQLDNLNYFAEEGASGLQKALRADLMQKEHCYRFAWTVIVSYTGLSFIGFFAWVFWPSC